MVPYTSFFSIDVTHHIELPQEVLSVIETLEQQGFETWVVGGFVRDSLLGIQSSDIDMASSAPWSTSETLLSKCGFQTFRTGVTHGTLLVRKNGVSIEITTFRKEGLYLDTRHPSYVRAVKHIQEDIWRRDFTINALAYHPTRGLLDLTEGVHDLSQGMLRCVGNPYARFSEDALRVLRACRFACRFGLVMDDKTQSALYACKEKLLLVAPERMGQELVHLLSSRNFASFCVRYPKILAVCFRTCDIALTCKVKKEITDAVLFLHGIHAGNPSLACTLGCVCSYLSDADYPWQNLLHRFAFPASFQKRVCMLVELAQRVPVWFEEEMTAQAYDRISCETTFVRTLHIMQAISLATSSLYPYLSRKDVLQLVSCAFSIIQAKQMCADARNDTSSCSVSFNVFVRNAPHLLAYITTRRSFAHTRELAIGGRDILEQGFKGRMIAEVQISLAKDVARGLVLNKKEPLLIRAAHMHSCV